MLESTYNISGQNLGTLSLKNWEAMSTMHGGQAIGNFTQKCDKFQIIHGIGDDVEFGDLDT